MEKELILSRAKSAGIARDFQTAIKLYKMILKEDASNTEILNLIGSSYVKLGDDEKALLYYEQIITFSPHDVDAMNSMGAIYRRLKRYNESITILQKALDEDANTATVNYNLGFTYKEMGNFDDAISAFKSVVEENPEDVLAHNHMGTIYYQKKDYQKSIGCFRKGLQVDPNHPILQYNLAKCYEAENQYNEAVRCYEIALKARPGWLDALRDFSELLIKCQKTDEARNIVKRTIELNPNDARLYMLLGEVFLNEYDFDSAISTFNEADSLEENNIRILKGLAEALEKGEQPQEAVAVMDKILNLDPKNLDVQKQFVHALLSAEEYERAYSQVDSLYEENGENDAQVLDLYGQYYICVDDDENAKKYFDKIPTVDPKYSLYLLEAANRYSQIGKIHQAEELAKKYISKNPTDVKGHNSLGRIYTKKGDTEAAGAAFKKGIEYLPNNVYAKNQLKRLDRLRVKTEGAFPQSSVAVRSGDISEEDKTFINTDIAFDADDSDFNFSDIITKAQKKYADEQTASMNAEDFPDNDMDISEFIEENGDVSVADIPDEQIVNEKDQYLDDSAEKDLMKNDVNPNDFFADYPKAPAYPSKDDGAVESAAPSQYQQEADNTAAQTPALNDVPAEPSATEPKAAENPELDSQNQLPFDRDSLSTPEDYYNAATQAADMAIDAAEKALKSLQDIDEKFAEQEALLQDKFAKQEEELERKTEELMNKKEADAEELTDEEKAAEDEFLDMDGFLDMADKLDEAVEEDSENSDEMLLPENSDVIQESETSDENTDETLDEALDETTAEVPENVEDGEVLEEESFPSLDDVLGNDEYNKNLLEETSAEEEKEFENAESDIIIDNIPEEDSETITEGDPAVDEILDFTFDSVDSYIQEDVLTEENVFDSVESIFDYDSLETLSEPEEIDTLEEDVADELLAVDEESINVNIVEEDAPFEDIISAAAEVAAESDLSKAQDDENLDVLEEDVFSLLDPMDTVRRYLPNIEKILQDTDYAHAHATELDLFIKMKKFCEFLPESELDHYKNSKIRMLLDYLIARLSGKPGLLVTTQSLLKAGVLGEGVWEQIYEKEVDLPFDESVRIVLEYMKKLAQELTSHHVSQALCAEADKVLEKLELRKL